MTGSWLFGGSPLASLETVPLNPELGQYFGVTEGMLVISVPADSNLGLKGGDVILSVDGQKPTDAGHLLRLMRRDTAGQPLRLKVMRHNKRIHVNARVGSAARLTPSR
jgi:S1-C subfamily serine protease